MLESARGIWIGWKRVALLILISLGVFAILFSRIEFAKILPLIKKIDMAYFLFALFISAIINIGMGSYKWQQLLRYFNCRISFKETAFIFIHSAPLRFILPFKSGELLIARYLKARRGFSFLSGATLLMVVDKIFNVLAVAVFFVAGCLFFDMMPWKKLMICTGLLLFAALFFTQSERLLGRWICRRPFSLNAEKDKIGQFFTTLSLKRKLRLSLFALFFQSSELLVTYLIFKAMGIAIPPYTLLFLVPLTVILCNIPVTLSGLGTREAIFLLFYGRYGSPEQLLGAGMMVSFTEYIFIAIVGIFTLPVFLRRLQ